MDYALVGSALFLLYGHPNLQLNRVAAGVAAWGVLFLLLPGVQKSRLQTIGWVPPLMAVAESNPSHTLRKPHQLNPQIMSLKRSQPSDLLHSVSQTCGAALSALRSPVSQTCGAALSTDGSHGCQPHPCWW